MPSHGPSAWQGVVEVCPWLRSLLRFPFLLRNRELPTFFPKQEASYAPCPDPHLHSTLAHLSLCITTLGCLTASQPGSSHGMATSPHLPAS